MPKPYIKSHLLDSGAHALRNRFIIANPQADLNAQYAFYDSKEFWEYVDSYAAFVKRNLIGIDGYVTVDAIQLPQKSWEVLKYLENEHGLHPMPVIHWSTPVAWVDKYVEAGYDYIGLGGLGQEITSSKYTVWADEVYNLLCDSDDRLPCVKTHGFAMTAFGLMKRYPWYSVDSASWLKLGAYGTILVPETSMHTGEFLTNKRPYGIQISVKSSVRLTYKKHYETVSDKQQKNIRRWLDIIEVPLGVCNRKDNVIEPGVINSYEYRNKANLLFYEAFRKALPEWPWPFRKQPTNLGLISSYRPLRIKGKLPKWKKKKGNRKPLIK